jgi:UPF0755 protein
LGSAALAVGLVAAAGLWLAHEAHRPGPLAEARTVVIPRGTGTVQIAHQLAQAGVTGGAAALLAAAGLARLEGDPEPRAGEYAFPAGASVAQVLDQISHGRTVVHRLTVAEGLTAAQVVALVQGEPALAGEIADLPRDGTLLPDTYHFSLGDSRAGLLQRMHAAMVSTLAELWPGRTPGLPLRDPAQAVVLASIVEKETGVAQERPRIAGVFYNRLAAGMRLQSDPTVIYALTAGKGALGRPLGQADLHVESPFNTYLKDGLPPAAIGNPGRASLQAVLIPERHEYLYFVARTRADHNHNVAHWRQSQHGGAPGG